MAPRFIPAANPPLPLWPPTAMLAIVGVTVAAMLVATGFHPTYLLDDTWIHLQFSEQIMRGHFGLVPGVPASPSSSTLYPLLLTPLAGTVLHQWQPALWNLAALLVAVVLWQYLLERFVFDALALAPAQRRLVAGLLTLVFIVLSNALWQALSGMEHTLQIAATLAVAAGLIELLLERRLRWWLIAGLIAGPLLRLENLSITLPAAAVLIWCGHWRWAALALAGSIGGIVAFGLVSQAAGLPFVGGPVLLKGLVDELLRQPLATLREEAMGLARTLRGGRPDGGSLVLGALLAVAFAWHSRRGGDRAVRIMAALAILSLGAQFILGGALRAGRHEIYSQCFALAALCFAARQPLRTAATHLGAWRLSALAGLLLAALFPALLLWTATIPWGAQDIWRQQWQMRRFAIEHVKAPVAVNDVGLVAYRNPYRVLDLIGLGSEEVRQAWIERRATPEFYAGLLARERIEVVMVYDSWFAERLPTLERVAEFHLGRVAALTGGHTVAVYATSPEAAVRLRQAVRDFAPSMPPGSALVEIPKR